MYILNLFICLSPRKGLGSSSNLHPRFVEKGKCKLLLDLDNIIQHMQWFSIVARLLQLQLFWQFWDRREIKVSKCYNATNCTVAWNFWIAQSVHFLKSTMLGLHSRAKTSLKQYYSYEYYEFFTHVHGNKLSMLNSLWWFVLSYLFTLSVSQDP